MTLQFEIRVPQYEVCDKIRALNTSGFFETLIKMIDKLGHYFD